MHLWIALSTASLASQAPGVVELPPITAALESSEPAPWPPESNMPPNPLDQVLSAEQMRARRWGIGSTAASMVFTGGLLLMMPVAVTDGSDMGVMLGFSSMAAFGVWLPLTVVAYRKAYLTHLSAEQAGLDLHWGWVYASASALFAGAGLAVWGLWDGPNVPVWTAAASLSLAAPLLLFAESHHLRRQARVDEFSWGLSPMKQGAMAGLSLRF